MTAVGRYMNSVAWGLCVMSSVAGMMNGPAAAAESTLSVDRFVDGIALNTHINYTDGAYANVKNVRDDLIWLGVRHVRDATPGASAPLSSYAYLANSGIRFDFLVRREIAQSLAQIKVVEAALPGSVEAVEGFNEINNWPVTYDGLKGDAAGLAAQRAIYAFVHGDASLANIPVYDLTGYDVLSVTSRAGSADYADQHVYAQNGEQPGYNANGDAWIKMGIRGVERFALPVVITEFGYFTLPQSGWYQIGVDEDSQAKGILNGLFDAAISGVSRTYLYELLDEKADPRKLDAGMHYGLFTFDNRAKPAATALHNLIVILKANGNTALNGIAEEARRYTVSDLPPSGRSVLLRKANGTFILALWNEVPFWDRASGKPVISSSAPVLVDLGGMAARVDLYDPTRGTAPIQTQLNVKQLRVDVPDHPVLLDVTLPN
jgi:hypothetical protein